MSSIPLYGKPKVGGDALSYCGRCKLELAHVIVAMLDSTTPIKVICKTCKTEHRYKSPIKVSKSAKKTPGTGGTRRITSSNHGEVWEKVMAERTAKAHLNYSPKDKFKVGDCLIHPTFGLGLVEEVKDSANKIVVLFREGEKILVHGLA